MKIRTAEIAGVKIGDSYPVCIAAEIGTYFGTDLVLAKEYVDVAKEANVEFLKTEILHDLSVLWDSSMTHTYNTDFGHKTENYRDLLERKRVPLNEYEKLIEYCSDRGLPVIASVYDIKGVDFMVASGGASVKIASQNITNRPLIEHCAKSGLPVIMDTGNALLHEVAGAVKWAEDMGVQNLIINHRPDGSPCPADKQNLRLLQTYSNAFGWPVGLACHYDGDEMIYIAIALGASFIEKPLYHKKVKDDQDTPFVLYYDEFIKMVKKARNCYVALGDGIRQRQIPEQLECRACIVAAKDIKECEPLCLDNVTFAWPMKGIPAEDWNDVSRKVAAKDLQKGRPIGWDDIQSVDDQKQPGG